MFLNLDKRDIELIVDRRPPRPTPRIDRRPFRRLR